MQPGKVERTKYILKSKLPIISESFEYPCPKIFPLTLMAIQPTLWGTHWLSIYELVARRSMSLGISPPTPDSALLHADMAKYCKGLMSYIQFSHQQLRPPFYVSLWSSKGDLLLEQTSEKNCSWTLLGGTLSGTVINKYRIESLRQMWNVNLWIHISQLKKKFRTPHNWKTIPIGDFKLRIVRDPSKAANLQKQTADPRPSEQIDDNG